VPSALLIVPGLDLLGSSVYLGYLAWLTLTLTLA
jgi:hypothetical protein